MVDMVDRIQYGNDTSKACSVGSNDQVGTILIVCGRTPTNYLLYGEQVTLSATQLVDPRQQFGIQ